MLIREMKVLELPIILPKKLDGKSERDGRDCNFCIAKNKNKSFSIKLIEINTYCFTDK